MARANQGAISIEGLRAFRADLKRIGVQWPKELRKVNRKVADLAAEYARGGADDAGGVAAKAAFSIKGRNDQTAVVITWGGSGYEFANGAFFGALQYQRFLPWIGNQSTGGWELGTGAEGPGQGPYGIGRAFNPRVVEELTRLHLDALTDLAKDAFPSGPFSSRRRASNLVSRLAA